MTAQASNVLASMISGQSYPNRRSDQDCERFVYETQRADQASKTCIPDQTEGPKGLALGFLTWGLSSFGRAPALHAGGGGIVARRLHHEMLARVGQARSATCS